MKARQRTVILDAEGLSEAGLPGSSVNGAIKAALKDEHRIVVPALTIAEVVRGKPADAKIWHVVNHIDVEDVTRRIAGVAGGLRERAEATRKKKRDLTVDAVVAAVALKYAPSAIITADVDDLTLLCAGADIKVIHPDSVV
jgi:predicted nucleic acid-binding protein